MGHSAATTRVLSLPLLHDNDGTSRRVRCGCAHAMAERCEAMDTGWDDDAADEDVDDDDDEDEEDASATSSTSAEDAMEAGAQNEPAAAAKRTPSGSVKPDSDKNTNETPCQIHQHTSRESVTRMHATSAQCAVRTIHLSGGRQSTGWRRHGAHATLDLGR